MCYILLPLFSILIYMKKQKGGIWYLVHSWLVEISFQECFFFLCGISYRRLGMKAMWTMGGNRSIIPFTHTANSCHLRNAILTSNNTHIVGSDLNAHNLHGFFHMSFRWNSISMILSVDLPGWYQCDNLYLRQTKVPLARWDSVRGCPPVCPA